MYCFAEILTTPQSVILKSATRDCELYSNLARYQKSLATVNFVNILEADFAPIFFAKIF